MSIDGNEYGGAARPALPASSRTRQPGFVRTRWRGEVPLATLFWRDMMTIAAIINIAMMFASLALLAGEAPTWVVALVFLSPLPWNVFLVLCVFRTAEREGGRLASFAKTGAILWLVVITIL